MKKRCAAFTLIELIVCMLVVLILAAAVLPRFVLSSKRAVVAEALAGCALIRRNIELLEVSGVEFEEIGEGLHNDLFTSDLEGTYFSLENYSFEKNEEGWVIQVDGEYGIATGIQLIYNSSGSYNVNYD